MGDRLIDEARHLMDAHDAREKHARAAACEDIKNALICAVKCRASEGLNFARVDTDGYGIEIWHAVPRLQKDATFEGFTITPDKPDEDDGSVITVSW